MIPENELLELLDKTEEEAELWLQEKNILKVPGRLYDVCDHILFESLADLATRLWERAEQAELFMNGLNCVYQKLFSQFKAYSTEEWGRYWQWWARKSKPIHRIVAAIIALQRAGIEVI